LNEGMKAVPQSLLSLASTSGPILVIGETNGQTLLHATPTNLMSVSALAFLPPTGFREIRSVTFRVVLLEHSRIQMLNISR